VPSLFLFETAPGLFPPAGGEPIARLPPVPFAKSAALAAARKSLDLDIMSQFTGSEHWCGHGRAPSIAPPAAY